jgi:hypothetical protein
LAYIKKLESKVEELTSTIEGFHPPVEEEENPETPPAGV